MKKTQEMAGSKVPSVVIDENLDKLNDVALFPDKVKKAKETIAKIGLPKKGIADASK